VGQYIQEKTDSLRDDSADRCADIPQGPDSLRRAAASRSNLFHVDVLLSYQPVPGRSCSAGMGSDMTDEAGFQSGASGRTEDAFLP